MAPKINLFFTRKLGPPSKESDNFSQHWLGIGGTVLVALYLTSRKGAIDCSRVLFVRLAAPGKDADILCCKRALFSLRDDLRVELRQAGRTAGGRGKCTRLSLSVCLSRQMRAHVCRCLRMRLSGRGLDQAELCDYDFLFYLLKQLRRKLLCCL